MGPRRLAAEAVVGFLVEHGDLNARIVREAGLEHCLRPDPVPAARPWEVTTLLPSEARSQGGGGTAGPLLLAAEYHPALLLAATLFLSWHAGRTVQSRREWRLASLRRSNVSSRLESLCRFLASSSFRLAAAHLAGSAALDDVLSPLDDGWDLDLDHGTIDALRGLRAASPSLFAASLWSMLGCLAVALAVMGWGVLDPRNEWASLAEIKKTWKRRHVLDGLLAAASAGTVLWLAHADLPLFGQLLRGDVRIDLGLPPAILDAIKRVASSFVAFCLFSKLLPREERLPDGTKIAKKPGRPAVNPEVVKRMSALAIEARDRVKDPRRRLRRTYSEGNFGTLAAGSGSPLTPPRKDLVRRHSEKLPSPGRRGSFSPARPAKSSVLPPRAQYPMEVRSDPVRSNPLLDIHYAGPALSPTELIARLKDAGRIKIRRSVSVVHYAPTTAPPPMPMLCEEEECKAGDSPRTVQGLHQ